MVFEFDYVPLAIGLIAEYAPGAAQATAAARPLAAPEPVPVQAVAASTVPRLDLNISIPRWNQDAKTLRNERESPLLRLPAELKLKIWAMAYEDVAVHVTCKEGRCIGHFICDENRNAFYGDDDEIEEEGRYLQCRCSGSLLEPPYKWAPFAEDVKRRRELAPAREGQGLEGIGGMLLACREIYANARDYLYTHPRFILPTQRLLTRFVSSLDPSVRPLLRHLTLHTYFDTWRTPSASGFFGGSCDTDGLDEWTEAVCTVGTDLRYLQDLHLIVHVAGGDSTIWFENGKPSGCLRSLADELARSGRTLKTRRKKSVASEEGNELEKVDSGYAEFQEPRMRAKGKGKGQDVFPLRCWVTAAVESSRHAPEVVGSWVTLEHVRAEQARLGHGGMYGLRERNVALLRELEDDIPENWRLSWWTSVEQREKGAEGAGPTPWPFNHVPY